MELPVQIREQEDLTADAARWRGLPRSEREERQSAMRQNCAPAARAVAPLRLIRLCKCIKFM